MEFNRWWSGQPEERFWLEITDRKDLGVDLQAPQIGRDGHEVWHYSLITEVQPGDVVFHYTRGAESLPAITAWSRAVGKAWSEPIAWAPHAGKSTGERQTEPGWRLALEGHFPLPRGPVSLERIRENEAAIRDIEKRLVQEHGHPTYQPFETGKRATRAVPAYLAKLPSDFVTLFDELSVGTFGDAVAVNVDDVPGSPYRRINESALLSVRDPFDTDPALVERGLRAHARTQNELADYLNWHGIEPLSPQSDEPQFDLAFLTKRAMTVVEVKSLRDLNSERQLRLGLGQVLRYAHILSRPGYSVIPALALEHEPPSDWLELLGRLNVLVGWPGKWSQLLPGEPDSE